MTSTTDIEEILLNRVKVIGDAEWTLLGTPNDVIQELAHLITKETKQARIDELNKAVEVDYRYWHDFKPNALSLYSYAIRRIRELNKD